MRLYENPPTSDAEAIARELEQICTLARLAEYASDPDGSDSLEQHEALVAQRLGASVDLSAWSEAMDIIRERHEALGDDVVALRRAIALRSAHLAGGRPIDRFLWPRLGRVIALMSDAEVAEWWGDWSELNRDATCEVVELALSPADRARSRRIRIATVGPSEWVTGP